MAATLASLKPGQNVRITVQKTPQRTDEQQTILRLMRQDPVFKRTLKQAQEHRKRTLIIRPRGGRPWAKRVQVSKIARVAPGAQWTMPYTPLLAHDLASVSRFLEMKPA